MTLTQEISELISKIDTSRASDYKAIEARCKGIALGLDETNNEYAPLILSEFDPDFPDETKDIWPGHIRFPLSEQLEDNEKMLYEQLICQMPINRVKSDAVVNIMPKFGNAFLLSGLGLECTTMGDILENAKILEDEDDIYNLKVADNLEECLYIKKAISFIKYAKSVLPESVKVGLCFMMSPYDLAYLIRGSDIMIDMYEDPDLFHNLMKKCTELYIRSVKLLKEVAEEPDDCFYYFNKTFPGANLIAEDCVVMLSPELHEEFVMPYNRQIFKELGPCWIHFCGNGAHLLDNYCKEPGVVGIQYGQLYLNTPVEDTIEKHLNSGTCLCYGLGKKEDESYEEFFTRLFACSKNNKYMLFNHGYTKGANKGQNLIDIWHKVQDDARSKV